MTAFLLLLASIQLLAWLLPTWSDFKGIQYYLPLHVLMETASIIISMMVFAVGWNSHSRSLSGNVVLLASVFFAVGVLDFLHTSSYGGMPDFISPNDPQKHLNFWLSARLFAALALLIVSIRPWKPLTSWITRYFILGSLLGVTLLITWAVIYHQGWFPDTFIPRQGLTAFKKAVEYLIIVINLITSLKLLAMMRERRTFNIVLLFGAVCTLAMSEFYFTLYTTMTGSYNVLGHIYKVIAYLLIYRAIVVEVIEEPYNLLRQSENSLRNSKQQYDRLVSNIPAGVYLCHTTKAGGFRFDYVSPRFCALLNVNAEDVYRDPQIPFGSIHPENLEEFVQLNKVSIQTNNSFQWEGRTLIDGHIGWLRIESNPELQEDGGYLWDGLVTDITEHKHIEDSRKEALYLLQSIADRVPGLVYQYRLRPDGSSCFPYCSSAIREIYRVMPEEVREDASKVFAILHPDDLDGIVESIQKSAAELTPWKHEYRVKFEDGTERWLLGDALPRKEADGSVLWHGFITDITERKQIETEILAKEMQYQMAIETSIDGFWVVNTQGYLLEVNSTYSQLSGYSRKELLNMSIPELDTQFDIETMVARMDVIKKEGNIRFESTHKKKDGSIWPVQVVTTYSQIAGGRFFAFITDITERKEAETLILKQANYDLLTQLPNRRLFLDRLEQEIKKAQREQQLTALLFIDLDRFKEVNDTLGHEVGDMLLVEAADRIKSCVRDYDTVARLGGDEFTVTLSELSDASDIGRIAQNVIDSLTKPFLIKGRESFVSASIGIALYPEDATSVTDLLKNADQAMYLAKQEGRGRFNYFTRGMQAASETRMVLANDLRRALDQGHLDVYYQPIVDLSDGTISKAEALLRWNHPERGQISPATFIPIAEDTGTIHEIGDWVFEQAARQALKLTTELGKDFQISVNKSPVQFKDNDHLHGRWIDKLKEIGLPGSSIVVEITEGLLMNDSASVTARLLQFRDAGIQVSIDDFGTGYSALSYLKKFDIDFLKIDQSFTRNLALETEDFALCEAIVVMAHKLSIKVIAEGVETEQQHNLLKQIGCDYGQGYLYSRPVPVDEFDEFLKQFP